VVREHPIYLDGEPCKIELADWLHLWHPPFWPFNFWITSFFLRIPACMGWFMLYL